MTAQERYKILLNIVSKVGIDGDVIGEYGRTISALNGLQTFNEMNPPMPPTGQETPLGGTNDVQPTPVMETPPMV